MLQTVGGGVIHSDTAAKFQTRLLRCILVKPAAIIQRVLAIVLCADAHRIRVPLALAIHGRHRSCTLPVGFARALHF